MASDRGKVASGAAFAAACFAARDERSKTPAEYTAIANACKAFGTKVLAVSTYPDGNEAANASFPAACAFVWLGRIPTSTSPDDYTDVALAIDAAMNEVCNVNS